MGSENDIYKVEKFNGKNFSFWKMQIEDYLYQEGLYLPLREKPKEMKDEEWKFLDRKALGVIRRSLSKSVVIKIMNEDTVASLMTAISNMYEQPSAANKVHLIKKLIYLKMHENGNFKEHLNAFNETTYQLNAIDIKFDDEVQAILILCQMPESWKETVQSISASFGKAKVNFSEVCNMLMTEEIRRCEVGFVNPSALSVDSRGRDRNRGNRILHGRSKSRYGRSKSRNRQNTNNSNNQRSKKDIECWNCGKKGHFQAECRGP